MQRKIVVTAAASVAIGLFASHANAGTIWWQGGASSGLTDPNYYNGTTTGNAPATGDEVNFGAAGTASYSGGATLSWLKLRVGHNQNAQTPFPSAPSTYTGAGTVTISGAGSKIDLTGGASGAGNQGLIVGNAQNATLTITDGANVTSNRQIGVGIGSNLNRTGTVNVTNGGSLTASDGNLSIAERGGATGNGVNGLISMSGATSAISVSGGGADFNIGLRQAVGTYDQTDGTLSVDDAIEVGVQNGESNGSSFSISGGTATNGGNFFLGRGNSFNSTLTVSGTATLNVGNRLLIGGSTSGTATTGATGNVVNHSGGTINTVADVRVGDASSSASYTSTYNLSGNGIINSATGGIVGRQGDAKFVQTGGTANWNGAFSIGNKESATGGTSGLYEISAGDANFNTTLGIGTKGTGELRVVGDDATIDVTSTLSVSTTADGIGTLAFELESGDLLSMINVGGTATFGAGSVLAFDTSNAAPTQTVYNLLTATDVIDSGLSFTGPAGWSYQIVAGGNGEILQVVVPEPTALGLTAMAGLFFLRRRRQS
jgi:T5SS/PEP-CTERM-associated repeat protein